MILIDTNVLVYAYDPGDRSKQRRAEEVLVALQPTGLASLSAQVLGEFFRAITNRLTPRVRIAEAAQITALLAESFRTWAVDDAIVLEATRGVRDHRMPYWDAQIWATARLRGGRLILTEDFTDSQNIEGVSFTNPFTTTFDLAGLLEPSI